MSIAEACDEASVGTAARRLMGLALFWQGRFTEALPLFEVSLALAAREPESVRWDWHASTDGPGYHALTLACLGHPERAASAVERITEQWARTGSSSLARGLQFAVRALVILRDRQRLRELATMQVSLCQQLGYPQFLALGCSVVGWLEAKEGRTRRGLEMLETALASVKEQGAILIMPFIHGLEADALASEGRQTDALATLGKALEISCRTGQGWFDSELHRRRAEVLLATPEAETRTAEHEFEQAIGIAHKQSAKLFELRAALGLAQLFVAQGKLAEAHGLVAPVYGWFTEGFDTSDLREARQLLAELSAKHD